MFCEYDRLLDNILNELNLIWFEIYLKWVDLKQMKLNASIWQTRIEWTHRIC